MDKFPDLCSDAAEILQEHLASRESGAHAILRLCESPVEQIFLAASIDYFGLTYNEHFKRGQATFSTNYPTGDGIFTLLVEPQKEIRCLDSKYRVDFLFSLTRFTPEDKDRLWGKTVVEIDGHDFHEKTKEQASRDKKRDRDLLSESYFTMRFSGSDVFNNPDGSVEEIFFHLNKSADKVLKSFEEKGRLMELLRGLR